VCGVRCGRDVCGDRGEGGKIIKWKRRESLPKAPFRVCHEPACELYRSAYPES